MWFIFNCIKPKINRFIGSTFILFCGIFGLQEVFCQSYSDGSFTFFIFSWIRKQVKVWPWSSPSDGFRLICHISTYHLKYLNWYMLDWKGWSYYSRKSTVRVLPIWYSLYHIGDWNDLWFKSFIASENFANNPNVY